jgi:PfaB family protein
MFNKPAVIGFDAQFAGLENVDRVAAAFYKGDMHNSSVQQLANYDCSELLALSARRIMQANRLTEQQLAVIVVSELAADYFVADNYSGYRQVSCFADALLSALQMMKERDIAVLISAVNLPDEPLTTQQLATCSYDQNFSGYGQNCGVASVLLSSEDFAVTHGCYRYAYLDSYAVTDDLNQIEQAIQCSFKESVISSKEISAIEVSAPGDVKLRALEENALLKSYHNGLTLHSSLSCIKSVIGENGPLSELSGFVNMLFALQQRYRPAVQAWNAPQDEKLTAWQDSPFYLLNDSAPVSPNKEGKARYMAYSCLCAEKYCHLIVQENGDQQVHSNGYNANTDLSLFIVSGNSLAELMEQLCHLTNGIANTDLKALAKQCYRHYLQNSSSKFHVVLLAESAQQLDKEISLALTGIADAFNQNRDWKTPLGSYFCVNPQTAPKISFLYPGIGATYLGLGRDLLQIFPEIYPSMQKLVNGSSGRLKAEQLIPRSVTRLSFKALKQHDLLLRNNLADIAECGVGYACLISRVFSELLGIKADFAAGYSMGEVSMFAALNCWENPGQMSPRLAESPTFNEQLSGELKTLRALWNIPAIQEGGEQQLWESYNIKGNVQQVENAIQADERVYITLINTANSVVIAGYPADCLAVAKRLGVRAIALNVHNAIHSEPACQHYQQMIELYSMELAERIPTKLYSSSCYLPVPFSKKAIAVSIAKCLCQQVDFPRLINTLAAQESSLFIEMGAGRSLCTWTDKILTGNSAYKDCMTVAVNAKGSDQQLMIFRAVAKLLSVGVQINLKSFFYGSIVVENN